MQGGQQCAPPQAAPTRPGATQRLGAFLQAYKYWHRRGREELRSFQSFCIRGWSGFKGPPEPVGTSILKCHPITQTAHPIATGKVTRHQLQGSPDSAQPRDWSGLGGET